MECATGGIGYTMDGISGTNPGIGGVATNTDHVPPPRMQFRKSSFLQRFCRRNMATAPEECSVRRTNRARTIFISKAKIDT